MGSTFGGYLGPLGRDAPCETAADALKRLPRPRSARPEVWASAVTDSTSRAQSATREAQRVAGKKCVKSYEDALAWTSGEPRDEPEIEKEAQPEAQASLVREANLLREKIKDVDCKLKERQFMVHAAQRSLQNDLLISNADCEELALLQIDWADEQQQIVTWMREMDEREMQIETLEAEAREEAMEREVECSATRRPAGGDSEGATENLQVDMPASQFRCLEDRQARLMERIGSLRVEAKGLVEERAQLVKKAEGVRVEKRALQSALKVAKRDCLETDRRAQELEESSAKEAQRTRALERQVAQLNTETEALKVQAVAARCSGGAGAEVTSTRRLQERIVQLRTELRCRREEVACLREELRATSHPEQAQLNARGLT